MEKDVIEHLYEHDWTGGDSALAAAAFSQGAKSMLDAVATHLADMPADYSSAISDLQWREKLIQTIARSMHQAEMLDDFYSSR